MTEFSKGLEIGIRGGLDLRNLKETTQDERNAYLVNSWSFRQPLYNLYANSLMIDYNPEYAKLHSMMSELSGRIPVNLLMLAVQNMHTYMMFGWETGILNTFHTLTRNGLNKQQIMEIIMFSQLYAGMRGLGHVYRAAGDLLAVLAPPPVAPTYPPGWAPDPDAFKSGLDLSTRAMTDADRKNIEAWYEKYIGFVPNSIKFGIKHHPEFVKVNRAKWEVALKTVPKQFAPYQMLRHHSTIGWKDGLREAVLLSKSFGITDEWIILGITGSIGFNGGLEAMYAAYDAVEDLI